jgi:hypothetical protein
VLRETHFKELSIEQLLKLTGIDRRLLKRTMETTTVQQAMTARGWRVVTLLGGWKLVRED